MMTRRAYIKIGGLAVRQGFSLVELLVAMFVLLLISLMTTRIFVSSTRAVDSGNNKAEINLLGRAIPDLLAKDIQQTIYNASNTVIRFKKPVVSSSKITFSNTDPTNWDSSVDCEQVIVYQFNNGALTRNGDELISSSNIVNCAFSADDDQDPAYVEVSMELQTTEDINRGNPGTTSFKTRIFLDNFDRFRFEQ